MALVTFLSDYGLEDDFVGVCHGVIARIAPAVRVIDISHGIPRHDVVAGALVLQRSLAYMPAGVHLAVVDPGVGSPRPAVALRCDGMEERFLVGPDNGLLMLAAQRFGGVAEAADIGASPFALQPVAASFHGRDVFAPVAAQLALGSSLTDVGSAVDPASLVVLDLPRAELVDGGLVARVVQVDGFGNVALGAGRGDLRAVGLAPGIPVLVNGARAVYATTFADVPAGGLLLYVDSYGAVSLAVNRGSAQDVLGLAPGARVAIVPDA